VPTNPRDSSKNHLAEPAHPIPKNKKKLFHSSTGQMRQKGQTFLIKLDKE
jgi:rhodanese-related sulfurtransferase